MKVVGVVGTRPQFIKAAAVIRAIDRARRAGRSLAHVLVHTGQHYDRELSDVFFTDLAIPAPEHELWAGSGSHAHQTAVMLTGLEEVILHERPACVLVYGDTNTTLAAALAAAKLRVPVAHVEAGLRSRNRDMPEEINRIVTDHISTQLFCPTAAAAENLRAEGITSGVFVVGDVMRDSAQRHLEIARARSRILERFSLTPGRYAVVTVHRAENTDRPGRLASIVRALREIAAACPVVWPMHPRTARAASEQGLHVDGAGIRTIPPLPYGDMLLLQAEAAAVLTDSGGVQREAYWFGVPCLVLRDETEWEETIGEGANRLVGADAKAIVDAFAAMPNFARRNAGAAHQERGAPDRIVDALLIAAVD